MRKFPLKSVDPEQFRKAFLTTAPQFMEYQQHDAQEALGVLVDRLSEEASMVSYKSAKPSSSIPDYTGQPDEELAALYWNIHLQREASIIMSMFQGQFKSHTQCLHCQHKIVKFDPFLFLSLQVPVDVNRIVSVVCIRPSGHPLICRVSVRRDGPIGDLIDELEKINDKALFGRSFVLAVVRSSRISCFLKRDNALSELREHDTVYAFDGDFESSIKLRMVHREPNDDTGDGTVEGIWYFASPFVMCVPRANLPSGNSLYRQVLEQLDRFFPELHLASMVKPNEAEATVKTPSPSAFKSKVMDYVSDKKSIHPYPFYLKYVTMDGRGCSQCDRASCTGCALLLTDMPLILLSHDTIAIEWTSFTWQKSPELKKNLLALDIHESYHALECMALEVTLLQIPRSYPLPLPSAVNTQPIDLEDLLRNYEKPEQMSEQNFFCPKCHCNRTGTKQETVWRFPPFLMIQLQRFSFTLNECVKNDRQVSFLRDGFDVGSFLTPVVESVFVAPVAQLYDLYAVINHGGSFQDGHYITYAADRKRERWHVFNDDVVTEAAEVLEGNRLSSSRYEKGERVGGCGQ